MFKLRLLTGIFLLFFFMDASATEIFRDVASLRKALSRAKPGDTLVLATGIYTNEDFNLSAKGNNTNPIVVKAESAGGVVFTGNSVLRLSGTGITVNGFVFNNGYALKGAPWEYRNGSQLAYYCRITNCMITDYNPPSRTTENSYILMYGQHNKLDHCTISNKLNFGVTLAVILDQKEDLENYHEIVDNHFAGRPVLGSNGGETIRVGTSQSSLQSSRTLIARNVFSECDGEVEVISIKSCDNIIRGNFFYECAGVLALRHGHRNLVEDNVFTGNNKPNTGGIRVINEGHIIRNNSFYQLAGDRFFAALAVMNAVPNSLPNRYHQVKDVLIENNKWIDCANIEFCVGKDNERTLPPANVTMRSNIFINQSSPKVFKAYDDIFGFKFSGNRVLTSTGKFSYPGFREDASHKSMTRRGPAPNYKAVGTDFDILGNGNSRLASGRKITVTTAANDLDQKILTASTGDELVLNQEGTYTISNTLPVSKFIKISAAKELKSRPIIKYAGSKSGQPMITIMDGGLLELDGIAFDGTSAEDRPSASAAIAPAATMRGHYSAWINNCEFYNFTEGSYSAFKAKPGTYADTLVFMKSVFRDISGDAIYLSAEKDDAGRYSAEYTKVERCAFYKVLGYAVDVYRGGSDESTAGPTVIVDHCTLEDVNNKERGSGLRLAGAQNVIVTRNLFSNTGRGGASIRFDENSWDKIQVSRNNFFNSGRVFSFWGKAVTGPVYNIKPIYNKNWMATNSALVSSSGDGHPIGTY